MKKLNAILKFSAFLLLVVLMASCEKGEDPIVNSPETEAKSIKSWLAAMKVKKNHVDSVVNNNTTSFYYIKLDSIGTGNPATTGDTVTVIYTGMFIDGTVFDTSETSDSSPDTYTYVHKDTDPLKRMIAGWEAGIELLKKGEKYAFLFPSNMAYGNYGYSRVIPPYSPLIFVIEVTDIK